MRYPFIVVSPVELVVSAETRERRPPMYTGMRRNATGRKFSVLNE